MEDMRRAYGSLTTLWSSSSSLPSASVGREVIVFTMCFSRHSYLFLKSISLFLKSRCPEVIDDIHHGPVCRIGWSPVIQGTAKHKHRLLVRTEHASVEPGSGLSLPIAGLASSFLEAQIPIHLPQDHSHACVSWVQKIIPLTGSVTAFLIHH